MLTGRFVPRPKIGTMWFIMPHSTSSISVVVVEEVSWDDVDGCWFINWRDWSSKDSVGLYSVTRFWEAVTQFNQLAKSFGHLRT